jgi:general secretion pathway protein L
VPEFTPQADPALYAAGEADEAHFVACGPNGVMSVPLAPAALPLLPLMEPDAPHIAEPAVAALAEQVLQRKFSLQQPPTRWLAAAQSGWDLAQMEFASSGRARTFKKIAGGWAGLLHAPQWRPLRWAAVLLVAFNLIGLNAWAWKERSSLDAKRQAINRALTLTFPNVKVVVDAPIQMEKEVAALRQAAGASSSRDLETMLGALALDAPAEPLASIDYSAGSLRARFSPPPSGQARVASTLKAAGFGAVWQVDTLVVTPQAAP